MRQSRRSYRTDPYGQIRAEDAAVRDASRTQLQRQAASGFLLRPFRGLYTVPEEATEHSDIRAAMTHLGAASVAIVGSAVRLRGLHGLPRRWTPQVALPPGLERRQRPGVEIHIWDLPDEHIEVIEGLRTTTVLRTISDVCRLLPRVWAVSITDSALNLGLLQPDDLREVTALMRRKRSAFYGRAHVAEATVGAQSPGETRTRLILTDADLPPDALQVPVRSADGALLGYGDLGYELPDGTWLIVEFDGRKVHELPEALLKDRHRQNAFYADAGVQMLRFAWEDTTSPDTIPRVVGPVLRAAGWQPRPNLSFQARRARHSA